jgi:hypothetical protein
MLSEDRKVFEKREITEKHSQLWGSERKLSTDKLMKLLEKYKLWNIVVRDRKGFEHFLRYDPNTTVVTVVKQEELSRDISKAFSE